MAVKELIVELSRNCNLSCIMCGFGGQPIQAEWFMQRDLFEQVLDELGSGLEIIRLNGRGESTIHPEFAELVELAHMRCPEAAIHLFTNLSWDQPALLDMFIWFGVQLFISIDSPDAVLMSEIRQGCQPSLIERNLEGLRSSEPRPFMVSTLQKKNLHQIRELATYAAKHRCHLIFNTVRYDDGDPDLESMIRERQEELAGSFEAAISLLREHGLRCHCPDQMHGTSLSGTQLNGTTGGGASCPALHRELFITYNGKVQPCNMFHPYVLGDLQIQSLEEIREGSRWSWFDKNHFESDYCANCAYLRAEV